MDLHMTPGHLTLIILTWSLFRILDLRAIGKIRREIAREDRLIQRTRERGNRGGSL